MKILPRALQVVKAATGQAEVIALEYDERRKRRVVLTARSGLRFMVDLAHSTNIESGDAYRLEDGRLVLVEAATEALMEVTCATPLQLARVAWHLGNRHLAAQIAEGMIRIRADHVIADMLRGLGATVVSVDAPFEPERGAYHEH